MKTLNLFFIGIVFLTFFFASCDKDDDLAPIQDEKIEEVDSTGNGMPVSDTVMPPKPTLTSAELLLEELSKVGNTFNLTLYLNGVRGSNVLFNNSNGVSCITKGSLYVDGFKKSATEGMLEIRSSSQFSCAPDVSAYTVLFNVNGRDKIEIENLAMGNHYERPYMSHLLSEMYVHHEVVNTAHIFTLVKIGQTDPQRPTKMVLRQILDDEE